MRRALALALLLAALAVSAAAQVCNPCRVEGGTYRTGSPPPGEGPHGVLVVFHGYGSSGEAMLAHRELSALAEAHRRLLVAPDGLVNARGRRSWSHQGSPMQARDELAFLDALLADARARFAVGGDEATVLTGFSQGGSMVWDVACRRGAAFEGYVAIAGGFWEPMPERCARPLGRLVHVHGLDDAVVPLEGRPIGDRWRQADIFDGLDRFKAAGGCAPTPDHLAGDGAMHCRTWAGCAESELRLCLHPGGHAFALGPLAAFLAGR